MQTNTNKNNTPDTLNTGTTKIDATNQKSNQSNKTKLSKKTKIIGTALTLVCVASLASVVGYNTLHANDVGMVTKQDLQTAINRTPSAQNNLVKQKLLDYSDTKVGKEVSKRDINTTYKTLNLPVKGVSNSALEKLTGYTHKDLKDRARQQVAYENLLAKYVKVNDTQLKKYYNAYKNTSVIRYKVFENKDKADAFITKNKTIKSGTTYDITQTRQRAQLIQTQLKTVMDLKPKQMSQPLKLEEGHYMVAFASAKGYYSNKSFKSVKQNVKSNIQIGTVLANTESPTLVKQMVKAEGIKFKAPMNKYYSNFINNFQQTNE